jgi:hypothetical protein
MGPIEPKSENTQAKAHWFCFALRAVRRYVPLDPAAVVSSAAETAEGDESRCGEPTKFDDGIQGLLLLRSPNRSRLKLGQVPLRLADALKTKERQEVVSQIHMLYLRLPNRKNKP